MEGEKEDQGDRIASSLRDALERRIGGGYPQPEN